jgi:hypothetical protein
VIDDLDDDVQARFSDDGHMLRTFAGGPAARIETWPLDLDVVMHRSDLATGQNLSWREWGDAFADRPYEVVSPDQYVPRNVTVGLLDQLRAASSGGRPADNQRYIQQAAAIATRQHDAHACEMVCGMGAAYGVAKEALAACDEAVSATPWNAERMIKRGIAKGAAGDLSGAISDLQACTALPHLSSSQRTQVDEWLIMLGMKHNPFGERFFSRLRAEARGR